MSPRHTQRVLLTAKQEVSCRGRRRGRCRTQDPPAASVFMLVQFSRSQNPDLLTVSLQTDTPQFVFVLLLVRILSGTYSSGASLWIHVFV